MVRLWSISRRLETQVDGKKTRERRKKAMVTGGASSGRAGAPLPPLPPDSLDRGPAAQVPRYRPSAITFEKAAAATTAVAPARTFGGRSSSNSAWRTPSDSPMA
ncbi:hypothetical protein Vafri_6447 [Volvox africanus]|uniref:Uncharacterized protein n=1 Tax=Volvox africanus TaxID=51714 RepID=A0A8J4EY76_9CHLO|nr:hypothetical protein Vafri_6447 [Volvox africanus]